MTNRLLKRRRSYKLNFKLIDQLLLNFKNKLIKSLRTILKSNQSINGYKIIEMPSFKKTQHNPVNTKLFFFSSLSLRTIVYLQNSPSRS